ncbi:MAG: metal-dependent hydrolase [Nevskia sp.]|nr:metal-dependent hydrolase [Nevskia sp.]
MPRKPASRTEGQLQQRRVQFDWSQTPLEWIPGEPYASHFINEINMLLPAGEFWFCKLYSQALPLIRDDKLRQDVQGFVRQEAMHARAHDAAIAEYLAAHGIETESYTRRVNWLFEGPLADHPFGIKVPAPLRRQWLVFRLGLVAAIEHQTCVLGKYVLNTKTWDERGADPVMLDLLRWHGAEEVEHRCVAFDLYKHLGGTYPTRYYLMAIAFPAVMGLWAAGAAHLMQQDPRLAPKRPSALRPWIWLEWQRQSRKGLLPSLPRLMREQLRYFYPGYHPRREASTEQALAYLNSSPAAQKLAA